MRARPRPPWWNLTWSAGIDQRRPSPPAGGGIRLAARFAASPTAALGTGSPLTALIDTSVWLRFLRGEEAGLVAQSWITSGQALVHPFVVGELLLGGLSAENEALLRSLPWSAPPSPEALYDFIRRHHLARNRYRLGGRGPARSPPGRRAPSLLPSTLPSPDVLVNWT